MSTDKPKRVLSPVQLAFNALRSAKATVRTYEREQARLEKQRARLIELHAKAVRSVQAAEERLEKTRARKAAQDAREKAKRSK